MGRLSAVSAFVFGVMALGASQVSAGSIGIVPDDGCLSYAGVYFCDADIRPTGTGVFDPFLSTQRDGEGNKKTGDGTPDTYSSGWNTDGTDLPASNDAHRTTTEWVRALAVDEIATVDSDLPDDVADGAYRLFTVDINQEGTPTDLSSLISLVHFELYNCTSSDYETLSPDCTSFLNLFPDGTWVDFNYHNRTEGNTDFASGSGAGDIDVYVPDVGFLGPYIALRDGWGTGGPTGVGAGSGTYADNDGFQEWASRVGPTTSSTPTSSGTPTTGGIPEPAVLSLLGFGLVGAAYRIRRRG